MIKTKKNIFTTNQGLPQGMPEALIYSNSVNPTWQPNSTKKHTGISPCDVLQLWLMNLVIARSVAKNELGSCAVGGFRLSTKFYKRLEAICIYIAN